MKQLSFFLFLTFLAFACSTEQNNKTKKSPYLLIEDAERFQVVDSGSYQLISLNQPWKGSQSELKYLFYMDSIPSHAIKVANYIPIKVPLQTIVSNSTTHLAMLEQLEVADRLVGFAQTQYIYSANILTQIANNTTQEVGADGNLNVETILVLQPDAIIAYSSTGENRQLIKLRNLGMNVVLNADYMESSVLGRYEWIKFFGYLTGKIKQANKLYQQMVIKYDSLVRMTDLVAHPTVLSGTIYGSTWFLPAGKNYGANLIAAAGGDYLWKENQQTGWLNLDVEVVYERGWNVDYWIGVSSFTSLVDLKQSDERYADFSAFQNGNVYTYMKRVNAAGANDYFESGNVNPDRLLADHIKILHPQLLPNYELYYYIQLE